MVLALLASAPGLAAQMPRESSLVPFRADRNEAGAVHYVLGTNRFRPEQLARFVVGIEPFLRGARGARTGEQVVWRVEGERGYIALSTSPFAEGPRFLLSLQGEAIRPIREEDGVLATASLLGLRLLEPTGEGPPPGLSTPKEYAP